MYLNDRAEWTHASSLAKLIANWHWLPRDGDEMNVQYSDFDAVRVMGIMPFLTELCISTNDSAFYFMMLAPSPIAWFHEVSGTYPLIKFDANCSELEYTKAINEGLGPDGKYDISTCASAIALFPESLNWHIFAQDEPGLARVASSKQIPPPVRGIPAIKSQEDLESRLAWIKAHPEVTEKPLLC